MNVNQLRDELARTQDWARSQGSENSLRSVTYVCFKRTHTYVNMLRAFVTEFCNRKKVLLVVLAGVHICTKILLYNLVKPLGLNIYLWVKGGGEVKRDF